MSGIDRTQILRIDCRACHSKGYVMTSTGETSCNACGGTGMEEREVPYKFESQGKWTKEETAQAFEIDVDDVKDEGHADAKAPAGDPTGE